MREPQRNTTRSTQAFAVSDALRAGKRLSWQLAKSLVDRSAKAKASSISHETLAQAVQVVALGVSLRRQLLRRTRLNDRLKAITNCLKRDKLSATRRRTLVARAWHELIGALPREAHTLRRLLPEPNPSSLREAILSVWFDPSIASLIPLDSKSKPLEFADVWGRVYESLLDQVISQTGLSTKRRRKESGTYYTPGELIDVVLGRVFELLECRCVERADSLKNCAWSDLSKRQQESLQAITSIISSQRSRIPPDAWAALPSQTRLHLLSCAELLGLRFCDPAMGSGAFLARVVVRSSETIERWLEQIGIELDTKMRQQSRALVLKQVVWGVDRDGGATQLCRWLLSQVAGISERTSALLAHLRTGDSLVGSRIEWIAEGVPDIAFQGEDWVGPDAVKVRQANRRQRREAGGTLRNHVTSLASSNNNGLRKLFDAWTAAFFQREYLHRSKMDIKEWITTSSLDRLASNLELQAKQEARIKELAAERKFFHWPIEFPEVWRDGGFDAVIGNPPFVNAIEGDLDESFKQFARYTQPRLRGTADLGYRFLDAALDWAKSDGLVGFVLPRAVLNARAADATRREAGVRLRPSLIYAPARKDFFPGAQVYVCGLVLGGAGECKASMDSELKEVQWHGGQVADSNWWREVQRISSGGPSPHNSQHESDVSTVAMQFEVAASLTTRDAYDLRDSIVDQRSGDALKLLTTGLIEPNESLWGRATCRFLKRDFAFPRIVPADNWTQGLQRRAIKARRPKIVIAGLSSRVEAFFDEKGEYLGSVSTYSIFHPEDHIAELRELTTWLNSQQVSECFREQLGGNAMGGGNITMSREFLQNLVLPVARHVSADEACDS